MCFTVILANNFIPTPSSGFFEVVGCLQKIGEAILVIFSYYIPNTRYPKSVVGASTWLAFSRSPSPSISWLCSRQPLHRSTSSMYKMCGGGEKNESDHRLTPMGVSRWSDVDEGTVTENLLEYNHVDRVRLVLPRMVVSL